MLRKITIFQNAGIAVEDIVNPQTGEVDGRRLNIIDNDSGDVWQYPMTMETGQGIGQQLMGIGGVQVANGTDMNKILAGLKDKGGKRK